MTPESPFLILGVVSLASALIPALLFAANLRRYRPAPMVPPGTPLPPISVLIPARDEAAGIGPTVRAVLASEGVEFELIVLDDHSEDATARIVGEIAVEDPRVRLASAPPLPPGWGGKQHACWRLSGLARHPLLLFLDADVRLEPQALARSTAFLQESGADLVSGIPRQETVGVLEKLVIPLIHFVLLGFLPIRRMRRSTDPSYAAGCGQLFLTHRESYRKAGGHAAIRTSFHDGITLPRAYRSAGLKTDLFDPTDLATCRMYRTPGALWNGLAKNAVEGLAAPRLIVPITLILIAGQVLPLLLLAFAWISPDLPRRPWVLALTALAVSASFYPRFAMLGRFRQPWLGAWLHPLGILILLSIQWYSLFRSVVGRRETWKGRPAPDPAAEIEDAPPPISFENLELAHGTDRTVENSAWK